MCNYKGYNDALSTGNMTAYNHATQGRFCAGWGGLPRSGRVLSPPSAVGPCHNCTHVSCCCCKAVAPGRVCTVVGKGCVLTVLLSQVRGCVWDLGLLSSRTVNRAWWGWVYRARLYVSPVMPQASLGGAYVVVVAVARCGRRCGCAGEVVLWAVRFVCVCVARVCV